MDFQHIAEAHKNFLELAKQYMSQFGESGESDAFSSVKEETLEPSSYYTEEEAQEFMGWPYEDYSENLMDLPEHIRDMVPPQPYYSEDDIDPSGMSHGVNLGLPEGVDVNCVPGGRADSLLPIWGGMFHE